MISNAPSARQGGDSITSNRKAQENNLLGTSKTLLLLLGWRLLSLREGTSSDALSPGTGPTILKSFGSLAGDFRRCDFLSHIKRSTRPLAGILWGLFQAPVIHTSNDSGWKKSLSLTANRDLQAKGSAVFGVDPVAILVGDPSAEDELITRCRFSSIFHDTVLLFYFRITQTTSATSPGGIQEDRKFVFLPSANYICERKTNSNGSPTKELVYGAGFLLAPLSCPAYLQWHHISLFLEYTINLRKQR